MPLKASYRHTYRLFIIIGVLAGAGLLARYLLVPSSFGQYGAYRGGAVEAARRGEPLHLGQQGCTECHEEKVKLHAKDAHHRVQCEVCHGPGRRHAAEGTAASIDKPRGKQVCLTCHQLLSARPGAFPQIEWREHFRFVGVKSDNTPCTRCHEPHEPLYMDRDVRTARLHPLVQRCRDCHAGRTRDPSTPQPAGHPAIFECSYCHSKITKDFAKRPHHKVRCSTCHLFFKESEFAGRIIRDADPRFCLLCHRAGDFRSDKAPPGIEWPAHRQEVAEGPEDAKKRCIDCHRDRIHIVPGKGDRP